MRQATLCTAGVIAISFLMTCGANAQTTVNIWPGVAPGSAHWTWKEKDFHNTPVGTVIEDVVTPALTVFLPERSKATGTGVIIAPGGYCLALTMDTEGYDVARWLQKRGIAAFVLKYRLEEKLFEGVPPDNFDMDAACKYGIADAVQALKVVRQHATEWGISPDRVGIVGFSAGGMVASGALFQKNAATRPDFAALIYGAPFGVMPAIPAKLPPVFMAWSQDDGVAGMVARFYGALIAAGDKPEAHIFSAGGHGFGMKKQGTTSDYWIDEFYWWLQAEGFTKPITK